MKRTVLASVGCLLLSAFAPAYGADLPLKAAPQYVAPYYNWSGFYVGINGGYAFGSSEWDTAFGTTGGFDTNGFLIGGTLGYNIQTGALVWGFEGDWDWADISGSTSVPVCPVNCKTTSDWIATARGRIGYAFDRWLPYLTGGAAFGDVKAKSPFGSADDVRIGWTIGAGVEWAVLANWTVKGEYLYADLGSDNCSGCGGASKVKFETSMARVGVNYRF